MSSSNKQSGVILNHYLQCVQQVGGMYLILLLWKYIPLTFHCNSGCPAVLCMDCGTENSKVAAVQYAFRELHNDSLSGERSFRFGASPANIVRLEKMLTVLL